MRRLRLSQGDFTTTRQFDFTEKRQFTGPNAAPPTARSWYRERAGGSSMFGPVFFTPKKPTETQTCPDSRRTREIARSSPKTDRSADARYLREPSKKLLVLLFHAVVHYDIDSGVGEHFGGFAVFDAQLHPTRMFFIFPLSVTISPFFMPFPLF